MVHTNRLRCKKQQIRDNIMKKLCFIFIFLLTACHPLNTKQQQQDYICQSMIQGYLKIQQLQNYQFWHGETLAPNQMNYWYRPVTEHGVMIGALKAQQLVFECSQDQNLFRLQRPYEKASLLQFQFPDIAL